MNITLAPTIARWRRPFAVTLLLVLPLLPALSRFELALRSALPVDLPTYAFPVGLHLGLCALIFALTGRARSIVPFLLPAAFLGPFEAFYFTQFGMPSGSHVYSIIADTHADEALSWIGPWLLPLVAAIAALAALLWWAGRECWRANWRWQGRSRVLMLTASSILAALSAAASYQLNAHAVDLPPAHNYVRHRLSQPPEGMQSQIEAAFPWGLPFRFWRFGEHVRMLRSHQQDIASFTFDTRRAVAAPTQWREVYVLIIGESARTDRWGLYGAQRNTTPKLSARSDLMVFGDFVSAASATLESVNLMMTRRPPEAMLEPTREASVVTAFRQAGFQTYWLSNQGSAGQHDSAVSVIAHEANEVRYINGADFRGSGALDGDLLPHLQRVLGKQEQRQFIVLHTLGSHLNYAHRYPAEFEQFRPALPRTQKIDLWNPSRKTEVSNAYDNSVLYSDSVIDAMIEAVKATGAVATLLFVGDHGEALYDAGCGRAGHGFPAEVNYRVPMFIWTSTAWQAWRPDTAAMLNEHRNSAYSGMSIFPTLMGLAGLSIHAPFAHPDIGSSTPRTAARMVTHFGDYDTKIAHQSCNPFNAVKGIPQ